MSATTTLFGDGILDVHIANGVARITLGATTGQKDAKPQPSGMLVVPVMQLPVFARVLAEVTRQVEQRAKEALAQAQQKAGEPAAEPDQVGGAFRFNG
jgi:ABC-type phosphate transport system permease subunit